MQRVCKRKKDIDPADYRRSKSKRCNCMARVNIRLTQDGLYVFKTVCLIHNHPAVQDDNLPEYQPASLEQKALVRSLAPITTLGRGEILAILTS
jgi:hypothetical protein